jgi:hypothetical protein
MREILTGNKRDGNNRGVDISIGAERGGKVVSKSASTSASAEPERDDSAVTVWLRPLMTPLPLPLPRRTPTPRNVEANDGKTGERG